MNDLFNIPFRRVSFEMLRFDHRRLRCTRDADANRPSPHGSGCHRSSGPVFIAGDFNLGPDDPAWSSISDLAAPLIWSGATKISPIESRSARLFDRHTTADFRLSQEGLTLMTERCLATIEA